MNEWNDPPYLQIYIFPHAVYPYCIIDCTNVTHVCFLSTDIRINAIHDMIWNDKERIFFLPLLSHICVLRGLAKEANLFISFFSLFPFSMARHGIALIFCFYFWNFVLSIDWFTWSIYSIEIEEFPTTLLRNKRHVICMIRFYSLQSVHSFMRTPLNERWMRWWN